MTRFLLPLLLLSVLQLALTASPTADEDPLLLTQDVFAYPFHTGPRAPSLGFVRLFVQVDADGSVVDAICLQATTEAFANAALRGIQIARFRPASRNGEPVAMQFPLELTFRPGAVITSISVMDDVINHMDVWDSIRQIAFTTVPVRGLDAVPELLEHGTLLRPVDDSGQAIPGEAVVRFYIDRDGSARLPNIVSVSDPRLADAVIANVATFRFSIPTAGGKPSPTLIPRYRFVFGD